MRLTDKPMTCSNHNADEWYACTVCYRLVHVNDLNKMKRYLAQIDNGFRDGNGIAITNGIKNIREGLNLMTKGVV